MNAQQVKQNIDLNDLLNKLGHYPNPLLSNDRNTFYLSPLRNEKTPSFAVDNKLNTWYDFADGIGGNIFDLIMKLKNLNFKEALELVNHLYSAENAVFLPTVERKPSTNEYVSKVDFRITDVKFNRIYHYYLQDYLKTRGIEIGIAEQFCHEVEYSSSENNKAYYAIGLKNISGGYEIRNKLTEIRTIGKKDITMIKGLDSTKLDMFEGFFDFLTRCQIDNVKNGKPKHDTIIFNSTALKLKVLDWAFKKQKYHYDEVFTYFDNDPTGAKMDLIFSNLPSPIKTKWVQRMNPLYDNFNDLNEWHQSTLSISKSVGS